MTEISDHTEKLPPALERFVLHWGDMGGQWGVNRSVSQLHALLYLSERPLTAEELADRLAMARSNVSTSLKELQAWTLVRRVPVKGDRRDHFEAESDLWEMLARIVAGRKAREIDPAVAALRTSCTAAAGDPTVHPVALERLQAMLAFVDTMERLYAQMIAVPRPKLAGLLRLGNRIARVMPGRRKWPRADTQPRDMGGSGG